MGKKRHVVHITTVHHPYDPRVYYKQCLSLHEAGYHVTLISQTINDKEKMDMPIDHIPVKKYTQRLKRMIFGAWDAYKKAKQLKADIYVFHDPELLFVASLLKKRNNTVIYDIHEDYITSILQKDYLSRPIKKIIASTYSLMEKVFTRKMEKSLAEKYYKETYPDGVCILNYPLLNENMMELDRKTQQPTMDLLYTGNVTEERGAFIHATLPNIHPEVNVQFIGKCPKKLADKMWEQAGERASQLSIDGIDQFIVKERIEAIYMERRWLAGIALFPPTEHYMKKELTKFFEYMNAGLPIICSNFPVWKQFIETYECGIAVDPFDETAIQAAIETLHTNPQLAYQMGVNGKRAVVKELNWDVEKGKLLRWYDELIKERANS